MLIALSLARPVRGEHDDERPALVTIVGGKIDLSPWNASGGASSLSNGSTI